MSLRRTAEFKEFSAKHISYWTVDGTELTLVTDDDVPPGRCRENMRYDLAVQDRGEGCLVCVHWSDSFEGKQGTYVHGRGWKLHKPQTEKRLGLWDAVKFASLADWTEVSPEVQEALESYPLFLVAEDRDGKIVEWPGTGNVNQHLTPQSVWSIEGGSSILCQLKPVPCAPGHH